MADWARVDRAIDTMVSRLRTARNEEDFQAVGLLAREVLISVAQVLFDASMHPPVDGVDPSPTDAKRMLDAYLQTELPREANAEARRHVRSSWDLAVAVQHNRSSTHRDAMLASEAAVGVVKLLSVIASRELSPDALAETRLPKELLEAARGAAALGFYPAAFHDWHSAGRAVMDQQASPGRAWLSAVGDPGGHVVYGPYAILRQDGPHLAWFRLRFHCPPTDDDAEVLRIEAVIDGVPYPRLFRVRDNAGAYQLYDVPFSYQRGQRIELRVEKLKVCDIWVDYTAITSAH